MPRFASLLATAAFAAVVFSAQAQESAATPEVLHDGLLKVNLTDFISGKYSLSYERMLGSWSSVEATVTGIGMTTSDYTYTIAQPAMYPWDSFYPNLPADLDMEISGWECVEEKRTPPVGDSGARTACW